MLLLNREDIKKVYGMADAVESVREAFRLYSTGEVDNPLRTNIPADKFGGTLLFMPSYAEESHFAALKIINVYPDNIDAGLPTSYSQVILINAETGDIVAVIDGTYLTQLRTGAASGLCFEVLGKKDGKVGALIGTGGQAETQLEAMLTVKKLEKVNIFDASEERKNAFVARMQERFADLDVEIIAAESSDEAVKDADYLITLTPAKQPVFDATKCKEGITVSCVGAYKPDMQEMDPRLLERASKIYFDSESAVLGESGDILIPLGDGTITHDDFTGELGEVILGKVKGRESEDEIIAFETVGIGLQDLMAAKDIYLKAKAQGIGTEWE